MIVSPYDAELYGHWWFEGFNSSTTCPADSFNQSEIETFTPGEYSDRHPTNQLSVPCASSWGHAATMNTGSTRPTPALPPPPRWPANAWSTLTPLSPRRGPGFLGRLKQAARELMLPEQRTGLHHAHGHHRPYASAAPTLISPVHPLYDDLLCEATSTERWLSDIEAKDNSSRM